jgi:hypothetical protein
LLALGADPILHHTDLNCFLVPATNPNKLAEFHFFRVSHPDLHPKAQYAISVSDNGCEIGFDNRKL